MMERRYELKEVVSGVQYNDEEDALVWQYDSKSLYAVINFRGV